MYESARLKVDHVMGPRGPLTAADLPTPDIKRLTIRRKAEVVAAVRGGLVSYKEAWQPARATNRSSLSWQCCIDHCGLTSEVGGKGLSRCGH
jgi:Protein of unknown function (DUF1153)